MKKSFDAGVQPGPLDPMPLTLTYMAETTLPVDLQEVTPDRFVHRTLDEIRRQRIWHGNRTLPLAEMFQVEGNSDDAQWHMEGNLAGVHGIGAGMRGGSICVHGPAGRYVGSQMVAGQILVQGDTSHGVGVDLQGGRIYIRGHTGNRLGAGTLGSRRGMTGGTILVEGNAGTEIGSRMRRGWICVGGSAGEWVGRQMLAGTLLIFGNCGRRPGAGMRRGTIGLLGPTRPDLLPTFRYGCQFRPPMLPLMAKALVAWQFPGDFSALRAPLELYHGDFLESGRGEILLR